MNLIGFIIILCIIVLTFIIILFGPFLSIEVLIRAFIFFAIFSGFLRRIATLSGFAFVGELTLYVLPILSLLICLKAVYINKSSNLSPKINLTWTLSLSLILIGSFFPLQKNPLSSIISFAAFLPFVTFFFAGNRISRTFITHRLTKDLTFYAVANAVYCVYQFIWGFPIWDQLWINAQLARGYYAITVDNTVRPFGFVTSPAECATLLALGFFCCFSMKKIDSSLVWFEAYAIVCMFALLTTGVRTSIILLLCVFVILSFGKADSKKIVSSIVSFAFFLFAVATFYPNRSGISRILLAFTNPSQLQTVIERDRQATEVFTNLQFNPLGSGLGVLVNANKKYTDIKLRGTDVFLADAAVSLGIFGILLALFLLLKSVSNILFFKSAAPEWLLALPLMDINYIFNPNHYALTPLSWLALGFMARMSRNN